MANWKADDGTLINFEIHGDGSGKETLLLLPGLLGAISSQWRIFLDPLASQYRIVLMDFRGHGLSGNEATELRPDRILQDIVGLLDNLGINQMHVAGYSLGGYMGLMLALNQPRRVSTLLLHATKFYWTQEAVEKTKSQFDPDALIAKAPTYANQLAQEHGGGRWRTLVRQTSDLVGALSTKGITEGIAARLQIPVLVGVGDRDEMVSLPEALRLSRVFSNSGLLVLPNTRHPFNTVSLVPLLPMMQFFHRTGTNAPSSSSSSSRRR
jgi:pimeloyl-ACP methyl ester carboxylesterase